MKPLSGKTALVTGGGSGVGLGTARALAAAGASVTICGRNLEKLQAVAGDDLAVEPCDISNREEVNALIAKLGAPDILINSAGVNIAKRKVSEIDPDDFDKLLAINCTGFFNLIHAALPAMRKRQDGLIFNISSVAGKRAYPLAGMAYATSKFGVTGMASAINAEEAENGIRVTSIFPGEINTPILDERPVKVPDEQKARMVHPEDIAALIVAIAQLPKHVVVPELVIKPTYQEFI
ncbi:MAG: NADP-dependent 3-hydroxy acid dehydrogenase YdfG [Akkermansiaceae bacterium]|jgi:NADP-dependent 3-hydroxy acid dehydrogenase YdfG